MSMLLKDAVSKFLNSYHNVSTRRSYEQALNPFVEGFRGMRPVEKFTADDIDQWEEQLHNRSLAIETVNSMKKRMKAFWNWCVKRGYIEMSPARFLHLQKRRINNASKAIPYEVRQAMLEAAKKKKDDFMRKRETAIMALLCTYGRRSVDMSRLLVSYINFQDNRISWVSKGYHEDSIYLPPGTALALHEWLELRATLDPDPNHKYVFVNNRTSPGNRYQPLKPLSFQTNFKRLSEQVSGKAYGIHSARHLRVQELFDEGYPRELIAQIVGHASVDTLAHYANQDIERQRRALNATELGQSPRRLEQKPKGKIVDIDPMIFREHAN